MAPERLQKVIAAAGIASRRQAERLIAAGRVTVDGRVATLGESVEPGGALIAIDGRPVGEASTLVHLVANKPLGVVATTRDRHAARTVLDLVPRALAGAGRLYPVGRLDQDSEGLILLTNDGAWADRVLHPRFGVEREYAIGLGRALGPDQEAGLRAGIRLDEGLATLSHLRPMTAVEVRNLAAVIDPRPSPELAWYRATLRQGWKRQLRRMFAAAGSPIDRLARVRIGTVRLGDAPLGRGPAAERRRGPVARRRPGILDPMTANDPPAAAPGTTDPTAGPRPRAGLVIAIDGPASSGKSSVGAAAARDLGYRFCDTGLLYRALTDLALRRGVGLGDPAGLVPLVDEVELAPDADGRLARVLIDGVDVTDEVRRPEVDRSVSEVSRVPEVRAALLARQRELAAPGGIVMAGRDIGTVVLPDADLKLFLDASAEERARRRAEERGLDPESAEAMAILADLRRRDDLDRNRPVAPLAAAADAVHIATDGNTFEQTVAAVEAVIRAAQAAGRTRWLTRRPSAGRSRIGSPGSSGRPIRSGASPGGSSPGSRRTASTACAGSTDRSSSSPTTSRTPTRRSSARSSPRRSGGGSTGSASRRRSTGRSSGRSSSTTR